jgi:hypothetical protein
MFHNMECFTIKRKTMLQCSDGPFHDAEYQTRHVEVNSPSGRSASSSGQTPQKPSRLTSLVGMRTGCQPIIARRGTEQAADCGLV